VDNDVITSYFTATEPSFLNKIPLVGQFLPGYRKTTRFIFQQCIVNHAEELADKNIPVSEIRLREDPDHNRLHAEASEFASNSYHGHHHLVYYQPITVETLQNYLNSLRKCGEKKAFPQNEQILTKRVCKDIVAAYNDFKGNYSSDGAYVVSNNPNYRLSMPTIADHHAGLMAGNSIAYLEGPPIDKTSSFNVSDATVMAGVGSLVLICARKLGLFGRTHHDTNKSHESKQLHKTVAVESVKQLCR
jgi:hypothetical protein